MAIVKAHGVLVNVKKDPIKFAEISCSEVMLAVRSKGIVRSKKMSQHAKFCAVLVRKNRQNSQSTIDVDAAETAQSS